MSVGISRHSDPSPAVVVRHVYELRDFKIVNIDGATGPAYGAAFIDALPMGFTLILGAALDVTITDEANVLGPGTGEWIGRVSISSSPANSAAYPIPGDIIAPDRGEFVGAATPIGAVIRALSTSAEGGHVIVNDRNLQRRIWLNIELQDDAINTNNVELTVNGTLTVVSVHIEPVDPIA